MKKTIGESLLKKVIYVEPDDWNILERTATFGMSEDEKLINGNKATCAYLRELMLSLSNLATSEYIEKCKKASIPYQEYEYICEVRRTKSDTK